MKENSNENNWYLVEYKKLKYDYILKYYTLHEKVKIFTKYIKFAKEKYIFYSTYSRELLI